MAWENRWQELLEDASTKGQTKGAGTTQTQNQQRQQKARRVTTLATSGEKGRALAASVQNDPPTRDPAVLPDLQALFPQASAPTYTHSETNQLDADTLTTAAARACQSMWGWANYNFYVIF